MKNNISVTVVPLALSRRLLPPWTGLLRVLWGWRLWNWAHTGAVNRKRLDRNSAYCERKKDGGDFGRRLRVGTVIHCSCTSTFTPFLKISKTQFSSRWHRGKFFSEWRFFGRVGVSSGVITVSSPTLGQCSKANSLSSTQRFLWETVDASFATKTIECVVIWLQTRSW